MAHPQTGDIADALRQCEFLEILPTSCSTVMRDTFPNHNMNSYYRKPIFYDIGILDPLGKPQCQSATLLRYYIHKL